MRAYRFIACAAGFCLAALLTSCSKPKPPPPPDGTSGIQGVCLLPAEPPDETGTVPERKPWAGVTVTATHTNNSSEDPTWLLEHRTVADAQGRYKLALNPGDYVVSPAFSDVLHDVAVIAPIHVKVEPGKFTEFTVDYDKFEMHKGKFKDR